MLRRVDCLFLFVAALQLAVGSALGIWMGLVQDLSFRPVHAHMNLMGWASLAVFGLTYRAFPRLGALRLARAHFIVAVLATICFPFGLYRLSQGQDGGVIGIVGIGLWLISAGLFAVATLRLVLSNAEFAD